MSHRRPPSHQPSWNPPPPEHIQPWSGWATHEMRDLSRRLHDFQDILKDVTDELDRRALMIEAEQKAKKHRSGLALLTALLSNPALPYFGALAVLLLATWVSGDRKGALDTAKSILTK